MSTPAAPAGCDECRRGALGAGPQPRQIAVWPDGPTFLRRCDVCGTYWHETLRAMNPVTDKRAKELYPDAFAANP